MTIKKMMQVLAMGDKKGSALKELCKFYHCDDYDMSGINDKMADSWIAKQKCSCYEEGHWYLKDCGTCNGTKDREPCNCAGNRTKCDFYSNDDDKYEWGD